MEECVILMGKCAFVKNICVLYTLKEKIVMLVILSFTENVMLMLPDNLGTSYHLILNRSVYMQSGD